MFTHDEHAELNMLKLRQIGYADMVVLKKVDLVGSKNVKVIKEWIGSHLNRIRIIEAVYRDVPLEILLAVGRFDPEHGLGLREGNGDHQHHDNHDSLDKMFDTRSYESERPFSLRAVRKMVRKDLPESTYRCKGIVFTTDIMF